MHKRVCVCVYETERESEREMEGERGRKETNSEPIFMTTSKLRRHGNMSYCAIKSNVIVIIDFYLMLNLTNTWIIQW